MAKGKPIGVRFDDEMIKFFREQLNMESHQTMLNYLWGYYASKTGIFKGNIPVDISIPTLDRQIPIPEPTIDNSAKIAELEEKITLVPKGQYYNKVVQGLRNQINQLKHQKQ